MKVTISELINSLAAKAGIDPNDKGLVDLLSNADLSKITVSKELNDALDNNLLTLDVAKDNHPIVAAHYKKLTLNGLDASIDRMMEGLDIEEDKMDEIRNTKNTYKRNELLIEAIKAQKKPSNTDNSGLKKQVDELLSALSEKDKEIKNKEIEYTNKRKNEIKEFKLQHKLSGYKTNIDDLDEDARVASMKVLIAKKLSEVNGTIGIDENGRLEPQDQDGNTLLLPNHTKMSIDQLLDDALNPIVKKAPAQGEAQTPTQRVVDPSAITAANASNRRGADINRLTREAMSSQTNDR